MFKVQKSMGFSLVATAGLYICEEEFLGDNDGSMALHLPSSLPRNRQGKIVKAYGLYLTSLRDNVSQKLHNTSR